MIHLTKIIIVLTLKRCSLPWLEPLENPTDSLRGTSLMGAIHIHILCTQTTFVWFYHLDFLMNPDCRPGPSPKKHEYEHIQYVCMYMITRVSI